jgi:excinuclease UvrABC nuclease subunit
MKKTKLFKPYTKEGRCTLQPKQGARAGVYFIFKDNKPVYFVHSQSNLYKTMYRHFQSWPDDTQRRVTYKNLSGITCRVIFCPASKSTLLEEACILKYKPRDNEQKIQFYTDKQRDNIIQQFEDTGVIDIENVPF